MPISQDDFQFYQSYLVKQTGLAIPENKVYLLETRLMPVLQQWGFSSLSDMAKTLRCNPERKLFQDVVDAMVTNETMFFRDERLFTYFRDSILPDMIERKTGARSLRFWSAACSTGQEPYSIAMALNDLLAGKDGWRADILATDISDHALKRACRGEYNQFEMRRGLSDCFSDKYFTQRDKIWVIDDVIRKMVRFENFNLLDRMSHFGMFDVIFCRNVLIYFNEETKKKILKNITAQLVEGGYLFLGTAERAIGARDGMLAVPDCPGLYCYAGENIRRPT